MARRAIAAPPMLPGFSVVRPLGSGGFADVFLYEQDLPRRVVAVKVLSSDTVSPAVLRAFNAEADILARLSTHPSIVTIHLASIAADGRPYFVMEYCPDTLGARARRGPLPIAEALDAGVRIGGALESAHRAGLLHRDIKPSNLLVSSLGAPVLADFGIAAALTISGDTSLAMSVPWSAPEVLQEQTTGTVPSEVWSLAATIYTLLAGRSPFEVERRELNTRDQITRRVIAAKYVPTGRADVPPRLEQALATAMSKSPERRYATAHALAEELRWVQYELGLPPTTLEVAAPEWARAGGTIDLADERHRGEVVTVVKPDSRSAARERARLEAAEVDRDGLVIRDRRRGRNVAPALIGAGVAVVVLVGMAVVLRAIGVL
ncbi:serine/threonine-protein kinase [Schumannella sp. 10F1B-5-1]|uniref:serine/threonine-protein kinase n=1 Tax=Schumannella sp. 10F1B-5-1 TaxID=2590780 RepID=UPI002106C4EC|nr:serine/threonine-protein kinase [Schumannella sp. 10F1B-5-1]